MRISRVFNLFFFLIYVDNLDLTHMRCGGTGLARMASDSEDDESFAAGSDEGEDDESLEGDLSGSDAEVSSEGCRVLILGLIPPGQQLIVHAFTHILTTFRNNPIRALHLPRKK